MHIQREWHFTVMGCPSLIEIIINFKIPGLLHLWLLCADKYLDRSMLVCLLVGQSVCGELIGIRQVSYSLSHHQVDGVIRRP